MAGFVFHLFLHSERKKGNPYFLSEWIDSVAQLVEQYTFNVWVLGPSPSGITINENTVQISTVFFFKDKYSWTRSLSRSSGKSQRDHTNRNTVLYVQCFCFITNYQGRGACPASAGSPSGITQYENTVRSVQCFLFYYILSRSRSCPALSNKKSTI